MDRLHRHIFRAVSAFLLVTLALSIGWSEKVSAMEYAALVTMQSIHHQQQQRFLAEQKEYARRGEAIGLSPQIPPYQFVINGTDNSYSVIAIPRCENATGVARSTLTSRPSFAKVGLPPLRMPAAQSYFRLAR